MFCDSEPLGSLAFYGGGLKCGGYVFLLQLCYETKYQNSTNDSE